MIIFGFKGSLRWYSLIIVPVVCQLKNMNFNFARLFSSILFFLMIQIGYTQSTFPNRSISFSGGFSKVSMFDQTRTLIDVSNDTVASFPASFTQGFSNSLEAGWIWKRKNGKKGWNVVSVQSDFANLHNSMVTFRDTFVRGNINGGFVLLNNVHNGEDIFVSKEKYKPYKLLNAIVGLGRLYNKSLFDSKLILTYGGSIYVGAETNTFYQFFFRSEEEYMVKKRKILSGFNLNYMLSIPIGQNLRLMAKGTSELFATSIEGSDYTPTFVFDSKSKFESIDFDASMRITNLHIGLLYTLKVKNNED